MFKNMVSAIFELINFGIFLSIGWYLYQRFGKSFFIKQMQSKKQALMALKQEHVSLMTQHMHVDHTIIEQEEMGALLEKKVQMWNNAYQDYIQQKEEAYAKTREHIAKKHAKQIEHLQEKYILKRATPKAFEDAEKHLKEKFDSAHAGQAFMQEVVTKLKKN